MTNFTESQYLSIRPSHFCVPYGSTTEQLLIGRRGADSLTAQKSAGITLVIDKKDLGFFSFHPTPLVNNYITEHAL